MCGVVWEGSRVHANRGHAMEQEDYDKWVIEKQDEALRHLK